MNTITLDVDKLQSILICAVNDSIGNNIPGTAAHIKERLIANNIQGEFYEEDGLLKKLQPVVYDNVTPDGHDGLVAVQRPPADWVPVGKIDIGEVFIAMPDGAIEYGDQRMEEDKKQEDKINDHFDRQNEPE
jgi:hypothetical protein